MQTPSAIVGLALLGLLGANASGQRLECSQVVLSTDKEQALSPFYLHARVEWARFRYSPGALNVHPSGEWAVLGLDGSPPLRVDLATLETEALPEHMGNASFSPTADRTVVLSGSHVYDVGKDFQILPTPLSSIEPGDWMGHVDWGSDGTQLLTRRWSGEQLVTARFDAVDLKNATTTCIFEGRYFCLMGPPALGGAMSGVPGLVLVRDEAQRPGIITVVNLQSKKLVEINAGARLISLAVEREGGWLYALNRKGRLVVTDLNRLGGLWRRRFWSQELAIPDPVPDSAEAPTEVVSSHRSAVGLLISRSGRASLFSPTQSGYRPVQVPQGALIRDARFAPNDQWILGYVQKQPAASAPGELAPNPTEHFGLWEVNTGRFIAWLPVPDDVQLTRYERLGREVVITADGRSILALSTAKPSTTTEPTALLLVWRLSR